MKLVLQKDHYHEGKLYREGETIDVSKEDYNFIMNSYKGARVKQASAEEEAKKKLDGMGLTEQQFEEAKAIGKKV